MAVRGIVWGLVFTALFVLVTIVVMRVSGRGFFASMGLVIVLMLLIGAVAAQYQMQAERYKQRMAERPKN